MVSQALYGDSSTIWESVQNDPLGSFAQAWMAYEHQDDASHIYDSDIAGLARHLEKAAGSLEAIDQSSSAIASLGALLHVSRSAVRWGTPLRYCISCPECWPTGR